MEEEYEHHIYGEASIYVREDFYTRKELENLLEQIILIEIRSRDMLAESMKNAITD